MPQPIVRRVACAGDTQAAGSGRDARRADMHGMRRRANTLRDAGRGAVVCRSAWPGVVEDDASASEGES
ncbi:hypothetical protein KDX20_08765 [Burkholderia cenocepacia]|jgi:hypothetical protein|uniref:hypothetical protein n=1 Tax=Burkholderia cenocepacia TaxID=95486 RepID=UPI001B93940F|nr:hypothetical protein [Burkholderia cenocepacia]MBR8154527.1 hypothetical protein [Burkholderia cenocepacia]